MIHLQEGIARFAMNNYKVKNIEERLQGKKAKVMTLAILCTAIFLFIITWSSNILSEMALKTNMPDVCYKCHQKLKNDLLQKNVHTPFKMGKCSSCHNVHVSDQKGLIKENINTLCLDCHEGVKNLIRKGNVHGAISKGVCTDCHYGHSSEHKALLVKPEKKLCWDCHEKLSDRLKQQHVHDPFKKGDCAVCHDPHASTAKNHMHSSPEKTCKQCHAPRCKVGNVSIASITKDMDCTECHTGHSSDAKGLLGPYGHPDFLDKKCEQCHNPVIADSKITTKMAGESLCFSCHKKDIVKVRENDVHGRGVQNPCVICHSPHASQKKNLTVDEFGLCNKCHEATEKRTKIMEKKLKAIRCAPVKNRECFECHMPFHSTEQYYLKADIIAACSRCHEAQHKISHPLGEKVIDPRNGKPITCISCHSMHSASAEFMLQFDRKRQLCIQCHEK